MHPFSQPQQNTLQPPLPRHIGGKPQHLLSIVCIRLNIRHINIIVKIFIFLKIKIKKKEKKDNNISKITHNNNE